jgi:hypothetical protein
VIERYTRVGDILTYEATVEDPVMFTQPWVVTPKKIRHAGAIFLPGCELLQGLET